MAVGAMQRRAAVSASLCVITVAAIVVVDTRLSPTATRPAAFHDWSAATATLDVGSHLQAPPLEPIDGDCLAALRRHCAALTRVSAPLRAAAWHSYHHAVGPWVEHEYARALFRHPWPRIAAASLCRPRASGGEPSSPTAAAAVLPLFIPATDILAGHELETGETAAAAALQQLLRHWQRGASGASMQAEEEEDEEEAPRTAAPGPTPVSEASLLLPRRWPLPGAGGSTAAGRGHGADDATSSGGGGGVSVGLEDGLRFSTTTGDQSLSARRGRVMDVEPLWHNMTYVLPVQHDKALLPVVNYTWSCHSPPGGRGCGLQRIVVVSAGGWGHAAMPLLMPQATVRGAATTGPLAPSAPFVPLRRHLLSFQGRLVDARAVRHSDANGNHLITGSQEVWATEHSMNRLAAVAALAGGGGLNRSSLLGLYPPRRAKALTSSGGAVIQPWEVLFASSAFVLAPRGYGSTSLRLYEALQAGRVPLYMWGGGNEADGARVEVAAEQGYPMAGNDVVDQWPWLPSGSQCAASVDGRIPGRGSGQPDHVWMSLLSLAACLGDGPTSCMARLVASGALGLHASFADIDAGLAASGGDALRDLGALLKPLPSSAFAAARSRRPDAQGDDECVRCTLAACDWSAGVPLASVQQLPSLCGAACASSMLRGVVETASHAGEPVTRPFGMIDDSTQADVGAQHVVCVHPNSTLASMEAHAAEAARGPYSMRGVVESLAKLLWPPAAGGTAPALTLLSCPLQVPYLQRPAAYRLPPAMADTLLPLLLQPVA